MKNRLDLLVLEDRNFPLTEVSEIILKNGNEKPAWGSEKVSCLLQGYRGWVPALLAPLAGSWVWLMPAWRILWPGINILSTAVYLMGPPHGKLRVQEQWEASWPPFCTPSRLTSNMAKEKQIQERWCLVVKVGQVLEPLDYRQEEGGESPSACIPPAPPRAPVPLPSQIKGL